MTVLTGGLFALAPLELHASEELPGDHTVGDAHHHSRDEEQNDEQQHIPGTQPQWEEKNRTQRGEKELDQGWEKTNRTHQMF